MTVALIIGGGRSERMGTAKGELTLDGRTLLERAVDAVTDASLAIVVAQETELRPAETWPKVRFTLENPPFGGPVAGIAAGVAQLSDRGDAETVIVLPVDAPAVVEAAGELAAAKPGRDGVVLQDQQGWPQYLLGRYKLGSLRRALGELGGVRNVPVRRLGDLLEVNRVQVDNRLTVDVDTPEQAREAGIQVPGRRGRTGEAADDEGGAAPARRSRRDDPEVMAKVQRWQAALREQLGVADAPFDKKELLAVSEVIAKQVARPAVPITGYCIGLAVGAALARGEDAEAAFVRAVELAKSPDTTAPDLNA